MKLIVKKEAPVELTQWVEHFVATYNRLPTYGELYNRHDIYKKVKEALWDEQGGICCYCMKALEYYDSHLEHFLPRHFNAGLEVEYSNMLLSCNGEWGDRTHCGHKKEDEDTPMLRAPTDADIESYFKFDVVGHIDSDDARAMTTIRVLALDSLNLKRHREQAIEAIGFFDSDFDAQRDDIRRECCERKDDGDFVPFCTAIVYCIDHY